MAPNASQVIVLATPVFLLMIAGEIAWGVARRDNRYGLSDAVNSLSLGMLSQITKVFTRALRIGIYAAVAGAISLVPPDTARAFWTTWYGWVLALLFYDLCYYWFHRVSHESAVFWASHVVHHQSQHYNLSTALRQPSTDALLGWIFYLPMAVAGVPPVVFGTVALIDLLYQFWVHTEHVPRLGWFDRWFCSPSNHRVHHAVNDRYLDRNYGGVLIVWDRIFGTFEEEDEPCIYGTRAPLDSWDPLWSNLEVYWALSQDAWHARRWRDKLLVWVRPASWRPADVAARFPRRPFDIAAVRRFDPPVSRAIAWFATLHFVVLLGAVCAFLWQAESMPLSQSGVWVAALAAGLWGVGALLQGRITWLELLLVDSAAFATATSALGAMEWHRVLKPLTILLALALVLQRSRGANVAARERVLLLSGLVFSLAGDVLLMFPAYFVAGLVGFLIAHLCYIALFKQRLPWFPSRRALFTTLGFGLAMYAFLFAHLGPVLKVAVAAYVVVIALMAAQAIGRAVVLREPAAIAVAIGAMFFMASDTLLAVNRFALPVPLAPLWVLAAYYTAQILIARNALAVESASRQSAPGMAFVARA